MLEVYVLHHLPCLVQLYACVDLLGKRVHLVCAAFLVRCLAALPPLTTSCLVIIRDVIVPQLKMRNLKLALLELLDLHKFDEELLEFLVFDVVVEGDGHREGQGRGRGRDGGGGGG